MEGALCERGFSLLDGEVAVAMHLHLVTLHVRRSPQSVPLAAAFLQASVAGYFPAAEAVKVTVADYLCGTAVETMVAEITATQADLVGFSLYVWNRDEVASLVQLLRSASSAVILLGGGPEVTADPAGVMHSAPFDYLVVGEGEGTLVELLRRLLHDLPLNDLPGLLSRQGGDIPPVLPLCLDDLPSPWLVGGLDTYIPSGVLWQLARGCPFACDFCYDGMGSRSVRRFSLERVAAELDYLVKHGVRQVFVLDSTFNQDLKRAKIILKMIREKAPQVHFHFEIRYEFLDAESAQLFAEISCSLQIGLQSASSEVLGAVGRAFDSKTFVRKIGLLNRLGLTFGFDLIYGLPGDSWTEFRKSLDFALSQYPNQLDIFPLALLPGTPLAGRAAALQLRHLPSPPYTLLDSPSFSARDLAKARRLASACDIFYSRGKAVAWFNCVVTALKLAPSALLQAFSDWIWKELGCEPDPADDADELIWSWQRRFLAEIFSRQHVERLLPMALDLVDYHYSHAAIVQGPHPRFPSAREVARVDVLRAPLRRSASARLSIFHYEIDQLLSLGEPHLATAVARLRPTRTFAVIYAARDEIRAESLPREYFQLLERLDGGQPPLVTALSLGISEEEAAKFLRIALREGIVMGSCP